MVLPYRAVPTARSSSDNGQAALRIGDGIRLWITCEDLADIRTFEAMNAVYREFFPKDQPARSTLECKMADPSILVEIDCVARVR